MYIIWEDNVIKELRREHRHRRRKSRGSGGNAIGERRKGRRSRAKYRITTKLRTRRRSGAVRNIAIRRVEQSTARLGAVVANGRWKRWTSKRRWKWWALKWFIVIWVKKMLPKATIAWVNSTVGLQLTIATPTIETILRAKWIA
jgi:hypothetical protein